jgi:hypothetical protein
MNEQEQPELPECNRLTVERWRLREPAEQQEQQQAQLESVSDDGKQSSDDPDELFSGAVRNPEKAVLLHCLSSGLLWFGNRSKLLALAGMNPQLFETHCGGPFGG